ncbi:Copia protein [Anthophora plagiata]
MSYGTSGTQFAIQKLNSENYSVWSYKLELLLIKEKLWEVITENKPEPVNAAWTLKDNEARATIGLLVDDNQLQHIRKAKTAREAWNSLKEYHQKATLTSKVLLLKRLCRRVMKEDDDMEHHITTMSGYFEQLSALGQDLPDNLMAAMLLGSLPESYETLVTALESRPEEDFTLQLVKSKLIDEFKRRKGAKDTRENVSNTELALKSHFKGKSGAQTKKTCYFCKKSGHFKNECAKYKSWKSKKENVNTVSVEKSSSDHSFYARNSADNSEETCIKVGTHTNEKLHCWIIDSSATSNMSSSREFFQEFNVERGGHVRLADEEKMVDVHGIGSGTVKCVIDSDRVSEMKVRDVLYVPSLGSSLLSVRKLTKDKYTVTFDEKDCRISKNGQLRAVATLSPDLYRVKTVESACVASERIGTKHTDNCQHAWHRRFGHLDPNAISELIGKGLATGIKVINCRQRITYKTNKSIDTTSNEVTFPIIINHGEDDQENLEGEEFAEESSEENSSDFFEADVFEAPTTEERVRCRRSERTNRGVPPDRYMATLNKVTIKGNDILIAAKSVDFINEAANCFVKQFHLTDLGLLKHYLSIEIEKDKDGFYRMKQTKYIQKLLNRFGLEYAKGSNIPLDLGYVKNREGSPPMPKNEKYQQLIGALLYLAVSTRPDISASVAILSQHNKEPTTVDWTEAKRVVRYLKSTIHYELRLGQRDAKKGLIGFADADWAQNKSDRKSNSGYLFKYYGAPISWSCRKQACVALSSTEAEYVALAEASQEGLWIRRLLEDFTGKVQEKTPIYEDNQSCLKLICNNRFNHRTKHIDTKYHFVKELQVQGIMDYQYCPTEQMTADMLTKPLGRIRLKSIAEGCGLTTR